MALNNQILAALSENLEFEKGEMDALAAQLEAIVAEQVTPLHQRIAELEAGLPNGKVKRTKATTGNAGAKKPNSYSKFVKMASAISKGDHAKGKDISFKPSRITGDKAIARWSAAPDDLVDFAAEYKLEDLIQIVKGHDDFSNLMIASSLVWNMIPPAAKEQVTAVLA